MKTSSLPFPSSSPKTLFSCESERFVQYPRPVYAVFSFVDRRNPWIRDVAEVASRVFQRSFTAAKLLGRGAQFHKAIRIRLNII